MNGMKFNCSGLGRRDFLQVGLGGLAGLGFSDLLRAQAQGGPAKKKLNCILVWLMAGRRITRVLILSRIRPRRFAVSSAR